MVACLLCAQNDQTTNWLPFHNYCSLQQRGFGDVNRDAAHIICTGELRSRVLLTDCIPDGVASTHPDHIQVRFTLHTYFGGFSTTRWQAVFVQASRPCERSSAPKPSTSRQKVYPNTRFQSHWIAVSGCAECPVLAVTKSHQSSAPKFVSGLYCEFSSTNTIDTVGF